MRRAKDAEERCGAKEEGLFCGATSMCMCEKTTATRSTLFGSAPLRAECKCTDLYLP